MALSGPIPVIEMTSTMLCYSTNDLADELNPEDYIAHLDVGDMNSLDFLTGKAALSTVREGVQNQQQLLYGRGIREGVVTTNAKGLVVEGIGGRVTLPLSSYMEFVRREKPTLVVALAHEVPCGAKSKHTKTSQMLTERWADEMKDSTHVTWNTKGQPLLLEVVRCDDSDREGTAEQARSLVEEGARGLALGCVGLSGGNDADGGVALCRVVRRAINEVDSSIPIFFPRAHSLERILGAIQAGASYVSTNLPRTLTDEGMAALFVRGDDVTIGDVDGVAYGDGVSALSAQDVTPSFTVSAADPDEELQAWRHRGGENTNTRGSRSMYLNVNDPCFREDLRPLMHGCRCHCCRSHTRAYVHHLLQANELLANILLYAHNQAQVVHLFRQAREARDRGDDLGEWASRLCRKA